MLWVGGGVREEGGRAHHGTLGNGLPELAYGPQKGPRVSPAPLAALTRRPHRTPELTVRDVAGQVAEG